LLGSRELKTNNNFLFRGFDWIVDGDLTRADEFKVLTNNAKKDDGSNLERMIALSSFSESTGKGGYSEKYNNLVTASGFQLRSSEQNLVNAKTAHDIAVDQKSEFSGVDLDTEAARLLEQQQAYQALARVLSTAKEMLDTLLRSM
jgi:flagellar hook-associated protein 1 FlgK